MDYIPKAKPKIKRKKNKYQNSYKYTIYKPKNSNEHNFLGEIWLGKTNNAFPLEWQSCKANISSADGDDKLILYLGSTIVVITITTEIDFLKNLLSINIFSIDFKLEEENITALLYLNTIPLPKFNARIGSVVKTVFSIIFNINCDYHEIQTIKSSAVIESFTRLYQTIDNYRDVVDKIDLEDTQLKPTLRKYQKNAVRWMVEREQESFDKEILHPLYQEVKLPSGTIVYYDKHSGYIDLTKPTANSLRTGGILADEMGLGKTVEVLACILSHPSKSESTPNKTGTKSNYPVIEGQSRKRHIDISVDENSASQSNAAKMSKIPDDWVKKSSRRSGLYAALRTWYEKELYRDHGAPEIPRIQCICGDTTERDDCVECHDCSKVQHGSCLGYHRRYGEFYCPQCWMNRPLIESKATLIVTPQALKQQWCDEIRKHIRGRFKVFVYEGGQHLTPTYPTQFEKYDVVITTYSVLQNELRLSENGQVISLRRPPKYSLPGSPITRLNWWRLCLDEAQTVETPGRMVSEMAKKIHAQHRWAVTGTPISKDISDLYGLIDYLQFSPYSELDTWNNLLYKPYINGRKEAMHQFLAKILWRVAKVDVIDQINIPQQTFAEYWLDFSAVEKFLYRREHELCSREFLAKLKQMDLTILLNSINKSVLKKLLQPLLALRQACCHHQAVRGKYLATRKQVSSMEDLLNALIAKNINENEDYIRIIVSSLNGLAGIYLLLADPKQAVEEYRKVLQLSTRFCDKKSEVNLEIDKLQLIHTMHNLSEILEMYPSLPPTLRDSTLTEERKALEKKYLERFAKQTLTALEDTLKLSGSITRLQSKFKLSPGQWFVDIIDWITTNSLSFEYQVKLTNILGNASVEVKGMSERKILYMIGVWDEEITKLKEATVESIHDLFETTEGEAKIIIPMEVLEAATDCHLRPRDKGVKHRRKCLVCEANFKLKRYESKLFSMTRKDEDISNAGSWKPAPQEFMLRALHALGKQKNLSPELLYDGEIHFQILDTLKKEFKEIRKLWASIDAQVCAKDEVSMCKMRLRLKESTDKPETDRCKINRIVKQLTQIEENRFETIHVLEEHEVLYQKAVLQGEYKTNSVVLEKNLGTYKYLQTLHKQQTMGQNPDPCPICKNTLEKQWNILPCGHCYCPECIQILLAQTIGQYISCCVCRSKQSIADIAFLHTDKQVEKDTDLDDIKIKGNHSTKVEAVVRLVMKLKRDEENVKVLVFSHWTVVLKVLHEVMKSNNVKSEILLCHNIDKMLREFKDESRGVTALLLPVNLGAKGLNLIEATHVIFVEPLLNPGDELQAIGRIHRIGQTKPTVVHKFFIRNTIEENIKNATAMNAEEWDSNKVTLGHIKQLFEVDLLSEMNNEMSDGTVDVTDSETVRDNLES